MENNTSIKKLLENEDTKPCPKCKGKGKWFMHRTIAILDKEADVSTQSPWTNVDCIYCKGTGKISNQQFINIWLGEKLRLYRMKLRITLMEFAETYHISVMELTNIERGLVEMPEFFKKVLNIQDVTADNVKEL